MILTIPYQTLEVGSIHISPFQSDKYGKSIARLAYKDNSIDFYDVSILSPPVKVIDYSPESSRLRIDLSDQFNFLIKMNVVQEYLISTFCLHQQSFLGLSRQTHDDIRGLFHFLLNDSVLCLYIFPTSIVKRSDGTTCKVSELLPGDTIRFVIRIHGVSLIQSKAGTRLRLQHTVPSMWQIQ